MKILIDGSVFQIPATGIAKSVLNLYDNCVNIDPSLEITIIHRRKLKCEIPPSLDIVQFWSFLPEFLWRPIALPLYIYFKKPDMVHFPWNGKIPQFIKNTKVITTIFDIIPLRVPEFFKSSSDEHNFRKKLQESIDRSDMIFTSSEFSKNDILKEFKLKRDPEVIYIGPTIKCKDNYNEIKDNYFLYVGGYDKRKSIEYIIETFMELHKRKELKSKLILTGDKIYYSPYLKKIIEEGIEKGFLEEKGYVTDSKLCELYKSALGLVYPSSYEGFGLPPLEAMMQGCPVITTRKTSIPEVCGDAAYYIDVNIKDDLQKAVLKLENDEGYRKNLILKGKEQFSKFSWESISKSFLEKIKSI